MEQWEEEWSFHSVNDEKSQNYFSGIFVWLKEINTRVLIVGIIRSWGRAWRYIIIIYAILERTVHLWKLASKIEKKNPKVLLVCQLFGMQVKGWWGLVKGNYQQYHWLLRYFDHQSDQRDQWRYHYIGSQTCHERIKYTEQNLNNDDQGYSPLHRSLFDMPEQSLGRAHPNLNSHSSWGYYKAPIIDIMNYVLHNSP